MSASSCSAVGYYVNASSDYLTLAATWNGVKWVQVPSPNPEGATGSELFGVSCAQAGSCVAVGESFNNVGNGHTLAEVWDGTEWSLVMSANQRRGQENTLGDVSCTAVTDCTAVGSYFARSGATYPLIEKWNGSNWGIVNGADHEGALLGIDCSRARVCTAVGWSPSGTFTEISDGSIWRAEKSPDPKASGHSAVLIGVACSSPRSCDAVGYYTGNGSDTTYNLIESWNGHTWQIVKSARP